MLWMSIALIALFGFATVTHSQNAAAPNAICITASGEPGKCVPLRSCTHLIRIIENAYQAQTQVSAENATILRRSHCGTFNDVPHVCCTNAELQLNPIGKRILESVQCGQFEIPKVAGGVEAELFAYPWMALLKYKTGKQFRCGGTLITERYVLTAAHCVVGHENVLNEVRLGEHNISSEVDCQRKGKLEVCAPPVEDIGIERLMPHPDYRANRIHHDIALLRLNRSVDIQQRHIKAICLPLMRTLRKRSPDDFIVSGWGNTENGTTSEVLLYTRLLHRELDVCKRAFYLPTLTTAHICAGGENLIDSCKGDSGGPIAQIDLVKRKLRLVQFGIVSLGITTCGQQNYPGVYTNVSYYMPWISENIIES